MNHYYMHVRYSLYTQIKKKKKRKKNFLITVVEIIEVQSETPSIKGNRMQSVNIDIFCHIQEINSQDRTSLNVQETLQMRALYMLQESSLSSPGREKIITIANGIAFGQKTGTTSEKMSPSVNQLHCLKRHTVKPFEVKALDLMGPFPVSNRRIKYLHIFMDSL